MVKKIKSNKKVRKLNILRFYSYSCIIFYISFNIWLITSLLKCLCVLTESLITNYYYCELLSDPIRFKAQNDSDSNVTICFILKKNI